MGAARQSGAVGSGRERSGVAGKTGKAEKVEGSTETDVCELILRIQIDPRVCVCLQMLRAWSGAETRAARSHLAQFGLLGNMGCT